MNAREECLVFGEVAEQYDAIRPSRLLGAVANAIVDKGGVVPVDYDVQCYLGRRT